MALTKVTGHVVLPTTNIEFHNTKSTGIVTFTHTSNATSSTTGALQITGGVGIVKDLFVGGNITVGGTITYDDVTNIDSIGIITARNNIHLQDYIYHRGEDPLNTSIGFPSNDTIDLATAGTSRIRVTSAGKVGINSTDPSNTLDVVGGYQALGLYRNDFTGNSGAGIELNFGRAKADGDLFNAALITAVGSDNTAQAGQLRFSVLDSGSMDEKLRINSDGKIGVGVDPTNYPGKFVVSGDALICDRDIHSRVASGIGNSDRGFKQDIDGVEKLHLYTDNSNNIILEGNGGSEKFRITSTGDILNAGLTSRSFENDSSNQLILEVTGAGSDGNYGVINISGNSNSSNTPIGRINFVNRENSASTTTSDAGSKALGYIDVYTDTSDSNAGDDSGGFMRFATKSESGSSTERLRITSDGQLGLSVTPDTWSTGKGLTIGTSQATLWGTGDQINLSGNAYFNGSWKAAASKSGASQIEQALGNIDFKVSGSVSADSAITWIDAVRIAKDGLVGIGTDSPDAPLHIVSDANNMIQIESTDRHCTMYLIDSVGSSFIQNDSGELRFGVGGGASAAGGETEKVRIDSDGFVGIGTINPVRPLHIENSDCRIRLTDVGHATDVELQNVSGNAILTTNGASELRLQTNNEKRLVIKSTGEVGIGTDDPDGNFTIHTTTPGENVFNIHADFGTHNNRTFNLYAPANDNSGDPYVFQTGNSMQFKVDSYEGIKIHTNGLVGINTSVPVHTLHVYKDSGDSVVTIESTGDDNHAALNFRRTSSGGNHKGAGSIYVTGDTSASEAKMQFGVGHNISPGSLPRMTIMGGDGHVGFGTDDPGSILDIREEKDGAETKIRLFNLDTDNTTTQTAALYLSPDLRATALAGLRVIKENADMSTSGARDVSLTLNSLQNNGQKEGIRIASNGDVFMGGLTSKSTESTAILSIEGGNDNIGILNVHAGGGESSGELSGITFSHGGSANATSRAKAAIALEAIGSYGKGHLCFYVDGASDNNGVAAADEALRITSDGHISMRRGVTPLSGTSNAFSFNLYRDGGYGYGYIDAVTGSTNTAGVKIRGYHNQVYTTVLDHYGGNTQFAAGPTSSGGGTIKFTTYGNSGNYGNGNHDILEIDRFGGIKVGAAGARAPQRGGPTDRGVIKALRAPNVLDWGLDRRDSSYQAGTNITAFNGTYNINYSINGTTGTNKWKLGQGPHGTMEWLWSGESNDSNNSGGQGGWNIDGIFVDPAYSYMFITYVKRVSSASGGKLYIGTGNVAQLGSGTQSQLSNPYWTCGSTSGLDRNIWHVAVHYIRSYYSSNTDQLPNSGIYRMSDGVRTEVGGNCNVGGGPKHLSSSEAYHSVAYRSYLYYAPANDGTELQWAQPHIYKCDGTEPTLMELLGNHLTNNDDSNNWDG